MTFTMMCGLPNSGKTTKANALAQETGATIIRVDDYTYLYSEGYRPAQILERVAEDVRAAISRGEDIIYDAVNATKAERAMLLHNCGEACEVKCVYMKTPEEITFSRDKHGWSHFYAHFFEPPTEDEGFELIITDEGSGVNSDVET